MAMKTAAAVAALAAICSVSAEDSAGEHPVIVPDGYDRHQSPPGGARVSVGYQINDVTEVDEELYTVTMSLNSYMMWNDTRLGVNTTFLENLSMQDRW